MRRALLSLMLLAAAVTAAPPGDIPGPDVPPTERVTIGGGTFKLELAADPERRQRGLGGRDTLDERGGMLFVFPRPGVYRFWMDGCLIDIDLIFLDDRGRIAALHRMKAEPPRRRGEREGDYSRRMPRYSSERLARYAIELRTGSIDRLELRRGMTIELDHRRLKEIAR